MYSMTDESSDSNKTSDDGIFKFLHLSKSKKKIMTRLRNFKLLS